MKTYLEFFLGKRTMLFSLLLGLAVQPSMAQRGGMDGGGSCSVQTNEKWVLKDFIEGGVDADSKLRTPPDRLKISEKIGAKLGIELLDGLYGKENIYRSTAFVAAMEKLNSWKQSRSQLVSDLIYILPTLKFFALDFVFKPGALGCHGDQDFSTAVYLNGWGVFLSLPTFNKLSSLESQSGVFIKEGLRQLFTDHEYLNAMDPNKKEKILSKLVSILLTGEPARASDPFDEFLISEGLRPLSESRLTLSASSRKLQRICGAIVKLEPNARTDERVSNCLSLRSTDFPDVESGLEFVVELGRYLRHEILSKIRNDAQSRTTIKGALKIFEDLTDLSRELSDNKIHSILNDPKMKQAILQLDSTSNRLLQCAATSTRDGRCKSTLSPSSFSDIEKYLATDKDDGSFNMSNAIEALTSGVKALRAGLERN